MHFGEQRSPSATSGRAYRNVTTANGQPSPLPIRALLDNACWIFVITKMLQAFLIAPLYPCHPCNPWLKLFSSSVIGEAVGSKSRDVETRDVKTVRQRPPDAPY